VFIIDIHCDSLWLYIVGCIAFLSRIVQCFVVRVRGAVEVQSGHTERVLKGGQGQ
jgi:hypothetical protein